MSPEVACGAAAVYMLLVWLMVEPMHDSNMHALARVMCYAPVCPLPLAISLLQTPGVLLTPGMQHFRLQHLSNHVTSV